MKEYIPEPMDTTGIELPEDLKPLIEQMAKNVHEVWARARRNDGWKYGPVRDDVKKEHPGLVQYEKLSEKEKDYDRSTSQETLKFIIKSGFQITKLQ